MRTINNRIKKAFSILITLILVAAIMGCSKSDDGGSDVPVKAGKLSVTIDGVNNCNGGTILDFKLPYTLSQKIEIKRLNIKTKLSNGSSDDFIDATFNDTGSTITFSQCTVFGTVSWVDYEVRLESDNGALSNSSKIRVNKPNGAN